MIVSMAKQGHKPNFILLYIFTMAFILYLFASSVFMVLPYVGIVAFSVLPLFVMDLRKSIYYTFFLLPFSWYYPGYVILLVFFMLLFKCRGTFKQNQFIFSTVLTILELIHLMLCPFPVEWTHAISPIAFIALFFFLLFFQNDSVEDNQCIKFYCIGSCFAVLLSYLMIIQVGGFDLFISGAFRSGGAEDMGQDSIILNSNSAAYLSLTSFVCLLFSKDRYDLPFVIYIGLVLFSFVLGVCSFSRTFLFLVFFTLIAYIFAANVKNKLKLVFVGVLCAIAAISCFPTLISSIFDVFSTRLSSYDIGDAGGRTEIFAMYNQWLINNPAALFWGAGINYYNEVTNLGHATHCGLQQILVCTGIIGLFLYSIVAVRFYKMYKNGSTSLIALLPFFICFVFDQSIQFLLPQFLMFPFIAVAYMFRINSRA